MFLKTRGLLVLTIVVLAGLMLMISGGCQPGGVAITSGQAMNKTITTSDTKDGDMHAHVYNLDVTDGDTYRIEIQSMGMATIMLWECGLREAYITDASAGSQTIDWTFEDTGTVEIWVEAYEWDCPAEYRLTMTKL